MNDIHHLQDASTFELGDARLRLRETLRFSLQQGRYLTSYLIEDTSSGSFYRVGKAEYTFLSLLDGKTTLATAMSMTCGILGEDALSEQEAAQLCKWLVESGLAVTKASTSASRQRKVRREAADTKLQQQLNPISVRIPLGNPARLVDKLTSVARYVITWPMGIAWVATMLWAIVSFAAESERFSLSQLNIHSRDTWIWFGITWCVLKLIHESAHAVACHRFGGRVAGCGVLFLLLIPLPYVDVTSAWRFSNKYHRILVSAAGMLAETWLAAIATLVWVRVGPGMTSQICVNMMLAAGVNTLLFNLNPLMKFDGYHMLADWLELPNLAKHGQHFVNGIGRQVFIGLPSRPIPWAGRRGAIVRAYGVGAFVWRIIICFSLILGAANLLPGIGFVIAVFAVGLWVAIPTVGLLRFIVRGSEFEQPDRKRFGMCLGTIVTACVLSGILLPAPTVITAPITIAYEPGAVVRSVTSGFVETVHVSTQDLVKRGTPLITLRNDELISRRDQLATQLRESRLTASGVRSSGEVSLWQVENENVLAYEKQLAELDREINELTIRAPLDGEVILMEEVELPGKFVRAGQELLHMGHPDHKEAIALVSQDDGQSLTGVVDKEVQIRIWGQDDLSRGMIRKITPRVQNDLPHFAFAGAYGGPLAVVDRGQFEETRSHATVGEGAKRQGKPSAELLLLEPRYAMHVTLPAKESCRVRSGQTGLVHMRQRQESLGSYVWRHLLRWISVRIDSTHGI
ncbi:HlyD family efflux transporter periplasmic adaptor subunit [Stieleria varia]|uniref:Peptidase family M50 n=1 Tax=Stieleria varia TaxID=2528005 RepID=A0A5C6AZ71_9BACT|nr:HlyD family efflux transporter periplasmic adaptor subunit [Stieleria varia]TWU04721.1 Peptidase family M50 [Stieleria varia]